MLESIKKVKRNDSTGCKFSILLPTWNNLDYLKLCVNSILKNSYFEHQIIVIVNEGADGSLEWIKNQVEIDYIHAEKNIGICYALNICRSLIETDYVVYANDDMYFLPLWDKVLMDEIERIGHKRFMISGTMIEPSGNNPCVTVRNFGTDINSFREDDLLKNQSNLVRKDWSGSSWPPNVVHIDCWDLIGGMSIEFSPGMASDHDLARKLWKIGIRTFVGKGSSLVYHFGCKSTSRIKKNTGHKTFTLKWGISARTFNRKYLLRGESAIDILLEYQLTRVDKINQFLKRMKSCI